MKAMARGVSVRCGQGHVGARRSSGGDAVGERVGRQAAHPAPAVCRLVDDERPNVGGRPAEQPAGCPHVGIAGRRDAAEGGAAEIEIVGDVPVRAVAHIENAIDVRLGVVGDAGRDAHGVRVLPAHGDHRVEGADVGSARLRSLLGDQVKDRLAAARVGSCAVMARGRGCTVRDRRRRQHRGHRTRYDTRRGSRLARSHPSHGRPRHCHRKLLVTGPYSDESLRAP
jgi:hypothetical protein